MRFPVGRERSHIHRLRTKVQKVVNSIEIHAPHGEGAKHNFWHWQLNRWPKGKARAVHHWTIYFRRID